MSEYIVGNPFEDDAETTPWRKGSEWKPKDGRVFWAVWEPVKREYTLIAENSVILHRQLSKLPNTYYIAVTMPPASKEGD